MASEIRVNKIENRSGLGTVTFADTGVDLAGIVTATTFSGSGASLTNLPAANVTGTLPAISAANLTNVPAANITGTLPAISAANLTNVPAANITGTLPAISAANLTNIPAANIVGVCTSGLTKTGGFSLPTDIDAWAISSAYTAAAGSTIIQSNWYQFASTSDTHFPKIGDSMSQSSGIWTFPKTGIWTIDFTMGGYNVDNNSGGYFGAQIFFSNDVGSGDNYDRITTGYTNMTSDDDHAQITLRCYVDVTSVTSCRVKFHTNLPASKSMFGNSSEMRTGAVFSRIGDT